MVLYNWDCKTEIHSDILIIFQYMHYINVMLGKIILWNTCIILMLWNQQIKNNNNNISNSESIEGFT